MAIYTNLPVYKASYSLFLEVNRMLVNVPRDSRYSIGNDLRHRVMDIIIKIYRVNRTRDKVLVIENIREHLLEVQVYIRLLCDMKHISENLYIRLAEQTTSISKQLAAWEKSERQKEARGTNLSPKI